MESPITLVLRICSRLRTRDSGQSLIEVALILPVFFLLIFGFIDFCLILFSMGNANFASRAALRYVSTHSSTSYFPETQQGLNNIVAPFMLNYPNNTYSVNVNYYDVGGNGAANVVGSDALVTLTVSYNFSVLGHTYTPISYSSTGCTFILQ
jgi:Flp pilus assembly protein TadG